MLQPQIRCRSQQRRVDRCWYRPWVRQCLADPFPDPGRERAPRDPTLAEEPPRAFVRAPAHERPIEEGLPAQPAELEDVRRAVPTRSRDARRPVAPALIGPAR